MATQDGPEAVTVSVRNLGGIESEELTFERGVTLLTGRNATNRTSVLRSVAAGLGGSYGELKGDADEGEVTLALDGDSYGRRFERRNGAVRVNGDPYSEASSVVDLFSCLLETNPARRAVERGDGERLRELIMRPVDTEAITADIEAARRELRQVDERIDEIERRTENLPALERRREGYREDLADVEAELDELRAAVDEFEADVDAAEAAEAVVDELRTVREEYETVRSRLETQRSALDSLEDERRAVADKLAATTVPEGDLADRREELERLRRRTRELETTITNILSIVEFNEELVEDGTDLPGGDADGPVDALDPASQSVECWTCGTTVERADVAARLDDLRAVVDEKRAERDDLRARIDDLEATVADLEDRAEERRSLEERLAEIDDELDDRRSRVADLEDREADLRDRIEELENEAADSEELRDSELLDRYRRLSEREYERGRLEEQVASLDEEIAEVEALEDERDRLREEREARQAELRELRGRIERLERDAVETFNDQMETVLDRLEYENLERVWIERKTADGAESAFDLHVVRSTADGSVYEDTVDHLSESEREVVGLVVALAGYLVHDVHETVPVMLLDSLEAIDADRIAALVEYFADYAPFLLVALLPEDARALPDRYERRLMGGAVA
jgi:chromosome segregation ATPase